jgi:hypothetical protein
MIGARRERVFHRQRLVSDGAVPIHGMFVTQFTLHFFAAGCVGEDGNRLKLCPCASLQDGARLEIFGLGGAVRGGAGRGGRGGVRG